jgi:guanidinopropionase
MASDEQLAAALGEFAPELARSSRKGSGIEAVYISFDIDGLDASHAMGTGAPEIGGFSTRDAQMTLRSLRGKHVVGAYICEVAPMYDPSGEIQLNAANLMFEMLCVIAQSRQLHH